MFVLKTCAKAVADWMREAGDQTDCSRDLSESLESNNSSHRESSPRKTRNRSRRMRCRSPLSASERYTECIFDDVEIVDGHHGETIELSFNENVGGEINVEHNGDFGRSFVSDVDNIADIDQNASNSNVDDLHAAAELYLCNQLQDMCCSDSQKEGCVQSSVPIESDVDGVTLTQATGVLGVVPGGEDLLLNCPGPFILSEDADHLQTYIEDEPKNVSLD